MNFTANVYTSSQKLGLKINNSFKFSNYLSNCQISEIFWIFSPDFKTARQRQILFFVLRLNRVVKRGERVTLLFKYFFATFEAQFSQKCRNSTLQMRKVEKYFKLIPRLLWNARFSSGKLNTKHNF